jgi:predicted aconitase
VILTDDEKAVLAGKQGKAARKAMEILAVLGEIYGADHLVPVRSVQVSGVSYHNLGRAGLEWLEEMAEDGRAVAIATLNPAGMDLDDWQSQDVDEAFATDQLRVVNAYKRMGIAPSCTCTPYLVGNLPAPGEHVAWAESSAVAYANSVLGARTNREGGPSALAAALTGRTPLYGLHLDEHRAPTVEVVVEARQGLTTEERSTARWGALGSAVARVAKQQVPLVTFRHDAPRPDVAELKSFCASVVTYGGSPLFHIEGVTPEACRFPKPSTNRALTDDNLDEAWAAFDDEDAPHLDLVCLGCPHATLDELARVAAILDSKRVKTTTWICTARATAEVARSLGLVETIEASGAKVVRDTCFVVAPLKGKFHTVATDSAKGCFYARGHNALQVRYGTVERCLDAAVAGRWV